MLKFQKEKIQIFFLRKIKILKKFLFVEMGIPNLINYFHKHVSKLPRYYNNPNINLHIYIYSSWCFGNLIAFGVYYIGIVMV
jgi:hypothetical protein